MKELTISLNGESVTPLYEQIYQYLKTEIQRRQILPGECLPSSRALALGLAVSRSTVDMAYMQLVSEGYIESIPRRGYFVCDLEGDAPAAAGGSGSFCAGRRACRHLPF